MKRMILAVATMFICCGNAQASEYTLLYPYASAIEHVNEVIGVYWSSREDLAEELRSIHRYGGITGVALSITLKDSISGEQLNYDIHAVDDLPLHSVEVSCGPIKAEKCWFIKYQNEEEHK